MTNNKKFSLLCLFILLLVFNDLHSQPLTNSYSLTSASNGTLTDMTSGSIQLLGSSVNAIASSKADIGFDFWFMGVNYNQFSVNENGILRLGTTTVGTATQSVAQASQALISPFANNLATSTVGKVHYKVIGIAPYRTLIVEWQNMSIDNTVTNPNNGTFQTRLYETTGIIEFVYGSMAVRSGGTTSNYSIGISTSNTDNTFLTINTSTDIASTTGTATTNTYTAGAFINDLHSASDGNRKTYTLTPPTPNAPSNLTFSAVTQSSMTLNWADNASNEVGYAIYRSDDNGLTYTFASQTAANATNSGALSGLIPGKTYYWQVYAVSEGALSSYLSGSQQTNAATNKISISSGTWNTAGRWSPSGVPTMYDNVTIADGHTVTIDINNAVCNNLIVGQGSSGSLQYSATGGTAKALTVYGDINIKLNASFTTSTSGTATKTLNIGGNSNSAAYEGNLIIDGNFDMNNGTSYTNTNFYGSSSASISGNGSTCDFYSIILNKGSNKSTILEVTRPITINTPTTAGNRLILTTGTLKISSASTLTPYFGSNIIIAYGSRLWLNNTSASISSNNDASSSINGDLLIDNGSFNSNGQLLFNQSAALLMRNGSINVDAKSITSSKDVLFFDNLTYVDITGGQITIINPNPFNNNPTFNEFEVKGISGDKNFQGAIKFGDGTSSSSGNATNGGFSISVPSTLQIKEIIVNNPSGTNRNVRISSGISNSLNLENLNIVNGNFNINGNKLYLTNTLTNNGTLTANASGSTISLNGTSTQNFNPGSLTSALINTFEINNAAGVTINTPINVTNLTLTDGIINTTASNLLTVCNSLTSAITGGSTTSYINGPIARQIPNNAIAANYLFPIGKSNYQSLEINALTTSGSGTATIIAEVYDNNAGGSTGYGMNTLNTNRYWKLSGNMGTVSVSNCNIKLTETGLTADSKIAQSNNVNGTYIFKGGNVVSNTISSSRTIDFSNINSGTYFNLGTCRLAGGTYLVGQFNSYPRNLTDIAHDLSEMTVYGDVNFEITNTYNGTTGETFPITFTQFATSGGDWEVNIYPASTVFSPLLTAGNPGSTFSLINFDNTDRITIDGRPGKTGSSIKWSFRNTRTTTTVGPTFRFINDASSNSLRYLQIEGQNISTTSGTIYIGGTTGTTGNDNISISNCDIRDRSDQPGSPANAIYALGNASMVNDNIAITNCNIFNYFNASNVNIGVYIGAGNSNSIVNDNKFYQTAARTYTGNSTHRAICIDNASGQGFTINNNIIGYSSATQTGVYSMTGNLGCRFRGIEVTCGTATTSSIQNNTIAAITLNTSSNQNNNAGIFAGINLIAGNANIGTIAGNKIGSTTSNDNIIITPTASGGLIEGINASSTGTVTISNNLIGGYSITGASTIGNSINAIHTSGAGGNYTINNNKIGSSTASNNFKIGVLGITTASCHLNCINNYASGNINISNNTIDNISNYGRGYTTAINNSGGTANISNNIIRNITSSSTITTSTCITGISQTSTLPSQTISNNKIYNLQSTITGSTAIVIDGIYYLSGSNGVNDISKNIIHSFSSISTGATYRGLNIAGGSSTYSNNIIRLGIDKDGNSIASSVIIYGILKSTGTSNNIYNNSVYIGGNSVSTSTANTYAYRSTSAVANPPGIPDNIKNNLFINSRSNSTGTGKHYAFVLRTSALINSDYNIFYANGVGGMLASENNLANNRSTLQQLRSNFPNQEMHSGVGDPLYANPTGDADNFSLRISNLSPAEGTGSLISTITEDFEGDIRNSNSPDDIGADAGNYTVPQADRDIFSPNISYQVISNITSNANRSLPNFAFITDQISGVNNNSGTKPRIYYKKSNDANAFGSNNSTFNGWKWTEATNGSSPFSFNIDYALLFGGSSTVITGTVIQYFVVAQDNATPTSNVMLNTYTGSAATGVSSITTAPTTLNYYTISNTLQGNYLVGTGQTYTTLTGVGGFFQAVNSNVVTGDIYATIVSDITEPGTYALNQWTESGTGNYNLTIQPDINPVTRVISGNITTLNAPMIKFNGADRVTIDGTPNKYLLFRNTNSIALNTGATFMFDNGTTNCTLTNCIIESNEIRTNFGSIIFGAGSNTDITISNNNIRNATAGTTGTPANAIYSSNINNNNITVNNNYISNFGTTGILFSSIGNNATITDNHFFNTQAPSGNQTSISVSSSNNHNISNNYIGGTEQYCGGTAWINSGAMTYTGIYYAGTSGTTSTIENNIIQNISLTNIGNVTFYGIINNSGEANITNNIIGHETTSASISIDTRGNGNVYGIYNFNTNANISKNKIANIKLGSNAPENTYGIWLSGNNDITVQRNKIYNIGATSTSNNSNVIAGIYLDNKTSTTPCIIANNMISLGLGTSNNNAYRGIDDNGIAGNLSKIFYNTILISGTTTSTTNTYAYLRRNATRTSINNNILINNRDNGTGNSYAIGNIYNPAATGWAANSSNYNLLVTTNAAKVCEWGNGVGKNFADWKISSNSDAFSWNDLYTNVIASDLFNNINIGDFSINTGSQLCWYSNGKGIATASDIDGDFDTETSVRSTQISTGPTDIGADEFTPNIDVTPIPATVSGSIGVGNTQTFTFAGRTLASINWTAGTELPSDIQLEYYSGETPPDGEYTAAKSKSFWRITPTDGTTFTYSLNVYYDPAIIGNISSESSIRLAKKHESDPWAVYSDATVNTTTKVVGYSGFTNFSDVILTDAGSTLPVKLTSFTAEENNEAVDIKWSTASETNCSHFELSSSDDLQNWFIVATMAGAGNSNETKHYETKDLTPLRKTRYYKLKQVDYDGKSETFAPITVTPSLKTKALLNINAYAQQNNDIQLMVTSAVSESNSELTMLTISGQTIQQTPINLLEGENKIFIPYGELSSGLYVVRIRCGNETVCRKITIQ